MSVDPMPRPYPFEPFRGELPDDVLRMVTSAPVSRVALPDGRPTWLVLGYDEVCTVLSDPRFERLGGQGSTVEGQCPVRDLSMDGPAHTSLRRLAARAFTPRRVEAYRPRVQAIADGLVDAMEAAGPPADLIAGLVAPLPATVVCEVLGVPARDRHRFDAWAATIQSTMAHHDPAAHESVQAVRAYLFERLEDKRREPGPDLLSAWLEVQRREELNNEEIVGLAFSVLLGAREINSISAAMHVLFRHPQELAALRADPALLPAAVEETLRYSAVSAMFVVHSAVEDVELAGVRIAAGDAVMAQPWAANREPARFSDAGTFDVRRAHNPHLSFGYGPHFCLGAALGRMQVEVAVGTLLRRFPRLAPAVPLEELPWRDERMNCGIAEFPVTW
jgi:cytochrome P450